MLERDRDIDPIKYQLFIWYLVVSFMYINILPDVQYSKYIHASRSGNWSVDFYVVDWSFFLLLLRRLPFLSNPFFYPKNNVESSILTLRLSLKCPATRARALERLIRCRRNPSTYLFAFARKQKRNRRRNRCGRGDEIERDTILLRYNFLRVSERCGEEEEEEEVDF